MAGRPLGPEGDRVADLRGSMNATDLIRQGFAHLHEAVRADIAQVEPDWWWWQPAPTVNHIGFIYWHLVRDEDAVVSWVTRRPQLWLEEGWHTRLDLDSNEQGTGFSVDEASQFRYDLAVFQLYADTVWARTAPSLERLTEEDLDRAAWKDSPWNIGRQVVEGCLAHGWLHLGEIRLLMGLNGWRFRE